MRVLGLYVVFAIATLGSVAYAEKVKTNQPAKLLNHPGEQGKVLLKIKEGQNMTVLAKEGRWLKVRVSGRTGYVPRSKVDMASEDELVRNTRRRPFVDGRGTRRGFGSQEGPDDRIGADAAEPSGEKGDDDDKPKAHKGGDDDEDTKPKGKAHKGGDDEDKPKGKAHKGGDDDDEDKPKGKAHKGGDDDEDTKPKGKAHKGGDDEDVVASEDDDKATEDAPEKEDVRPMAHVSSKTKIFSERDKESEVAFTAKTSDTLYPVDTKGKWTMVETEEGDSGWVPTSSLDLEDSGGGGAPHKRMIDLKAGFGVMFIQQGIRTAGTTKAAGTDQVPDVYNIGTPAATIDIGARLLFPFNKKYLIGGEAQYDASKTLAGGITYMSTTTGITISDLNLRGVFAYPTQRKSGMMILGKLGLRYRGYLVDGYDDPAKNPAKIPQETLVAPTLGAALLFPKLTDNIGLQFGLDTILFGSSVSQTAGLEDGSSPSMSSVHLNVGFVYKWRKDLDLQGAYDLDYASYSFGPMSTQSTRGHTAADVQRTDIIHMVSFGLAKGF